MPHYAAIYLPDPSALGSLKGGRFVLDAGEVDINFVPEELLKLQLQALSEFVRSAIVDEDVVAYVEARIQQVSMACVCAITPGFDEEGTIQAFLFRLNSEAKGLLFFSGQLFDHNGEVLGG